MYAQLGHSKPFIITDRGDLKTLGLAKLPLDVDPKTGMVIFKEIDKNGKEVVYYIAIEVIRHFGKFGRIRVDSLQPEDIIFLDGNKKNNRIDNLGISEKAAERLKLIGATGVHANSGEMPPPAMVVDDGDDEEEEQDEVDSNSLEALQQEPLEIVVDEEEVLGAEPMPEEAIYHVVEPESGSYYDIADQLGNSILEKKLNGKSKVLNYLKEHGITVTNKEVLL